MTDARLAHAFPDLSEGQALLALLSETLELARGIEEAQREIEAAEVSSGQVHGLASIVGLPEELHAAEQTVQGTILELLARVSEHDLQAGRDTGLLSPEDYREALKAKRTLSLGRGRTEERENERGA